MPALWPTGRGLLVLDEATSGLDPAARSEILDILLDFIQDERHSVLLSSHITTDLEQIADTIAYLHHGQLLFAKNKDDLMEEYGILRCSQQDLDRLPPEWIAAICRTAAGCEKAWYTRGSASCAHCPVWYAMPPALMTLCA